MKQITNQNINVTVNLNGSVNGTSKLKENCEETLSKNQAIEQLTRCNYLSSFTEIAYFLEKVFGVWNEKPEHWHYIAQYYSPKSINSVIYQMTKMRKRGAMPLKSSGAYFTSVLKRFHKPRKAFRRKDKNKVKVNEQEAQNG